MEDLNKVLVGIQARSTSSRFPGKCFEMIGERMLLQHVIDSCIGAAVYLNKSPKRFKCFVEVILVVPKGDEIVHRFPRIKSFQGSEQDVLSRYHDAALTFGADHIVRVTGDCPLIPKEVISKCINSHLFDGNDFTSNAIPAYRCSQDGTDCEVFSFSTLQKAHSQATTQYDREHVTPWMIRSADAGTIVGGAPTPKVYQAESDKISVDTLDDLNRVRELYEKKISKIESMRKSNVKRYDY